MRPVTKILPMYHAQGRGIILPDGKRSIFFENEDHLLRGKNYIKKIVKAEPYRTLMPHPTSQSGEMIYSPTLWRCRGIPLKPTDTSYIYMIENIPSYYYTCYMLVSIQNQPKYICFPFDLAWLNGSYIDTPKIMTSMGPGMSYEAPANEVEFLFPYPPFKTLRSAYIYINTPILNRDAITFEDNTSENKTYKGATGFPYYIVQGRAEYWSLTGSYDTYFNAQATGTVKRSLYDHYSIGDQGNGTYTIVLQGELQLHFYKNTWMTTFDLWCGGILVGGSSFPLGFAQELNNTLGRYENDDYYGLIYDSRHHLGTYVQHEFQVADIQVSAREPVEVLWDYDGLKWIYQPGTYTQNLRSVNPYTDGYFLWSIDVEKRHINFGEPKVEVKNYFTGGFFDHNSTPERDPKTGSWWFIPLREPVTFYPDYHHDIELTNFPWWLSLNNNPPSDAWTERVSTHYDYWDRYHNNPEPIDHFNITLSKLTPFKYSGPRGLIIEFKTDIFDGRLSRWAYNLKGNLGICKVIDLVTKLPKNYFRNPRSNFVTYRNGGLRPYYRSSTGYKYSSNERYNDPHTQYDETLFDTRNSYDEPLCINTHVPHMIDSEQVANMTHWPYSAIQPVLDYCEESNRDILVLWWYAIGNYYYNHYLFNLEQNLKKLQVILEHEAVRKDINNHFQKWVHDPNSLNKYNDKIDSLIIEYLYTEAVIKEAAELKIDYAYKPIYSDIIAVRPHNQGWKFDHDDVTLPSLFRVTDLVIQEWR